MADIPGKACPFVNRVCLSEGCMAWSDKGCRLIIFRAAAESPFEEKLRDAAPLMYRSLLDLAKILENASRDCPKCGPDLWNYAQELRAGLLDDLIKAELALAGIRETEENKG
jgi:hypothetical protein